MTTTTDTGPDVQVTNADTGEVYPSQVLNEAARLDGAATNGMFLPKVPVQTERKPHLPRIRGLPAAAPLPEQHPARELAPDRLDADAARRRKALAQAAQGNRRELAAVELPPDEKAEKVRQVRAAFRRVGAPPKLRWWEKVLSVFGAGA